jgi:hypothetical protein
MPTIYNLRFVNNQVFRLTRDLSEIAAAYDLTTATIRMQARVTASAPDPPAYEWVSTNSAHGQIIYDAATHLAVFAAPVEDAGLLAGDLVYDCRIELPGDKPFVIFGGVLRATVGVTRLPADLTATGVPGLGDTVTVDGERGTLPVPLPLSLSAAIAAAQASVAASVLYVTAAPDPTVSASYVFALDTLAGNFYVRVPSGEWQLISGGGSPVVADSLSLNPINPLTVAALH